MGLIGYCCGLWPVTSWPMMLGSRTIVGLMTIADIMMSNGSMSWVWCSTHSIHPLAVKSVSILWKSRKFSKNKFYLYMLKVDFPAWFYRQVKYFLHLIRSPLGHRRGCDCLPFMKVFYKNILLDNVISCMLISKSIFNPLPYLSHTEQNNDFTQIKISHIIVFSIYI